jgi:hypothetical protein
LFRASISAEAIPPVASTVGAADRSTCMEIDYLRKKCYVTKIYIILIYIFLKLKISLTTLVIFRAHTVLRILSRDAKLIAERCFDKIDLQSKLFVAPSFVLKAKYAVPKFYAPS